MFNQNSDSPTRAPKTHHPERSVFRYLSRSIFTVLALTLVIAASTAMAQTTVYNAIPGTLAPSYASLGYQATQTSEFGDYVHLGGTDRRLDQVSVTMVNWAYQSEPANLAFCSANPGLCPGGGFVHPFTINVYGVVAGSPLNIKGPLLATWTQAKLVPWRPAPDPNCPGSTAWRAGDGTCNNGFAFTLNWTLSSLNVTLPNDIIVSIAYSTQSYPTPGLGSPGPYNSLNVAAIAGPASIGSDANADRIFASSTWSSFYTDGGVGGLGIFREDDFWGPTNGTVPFRVTASTIAIAPSADVVYVNTAWTGTTPGSDPDGAGPASNFGVLSFATIQGGINGVNVGGTVHVASGNYIESVNLNKANVSLKGAGIDSTYIIGQHNTGGPTTLLIDGTGALVEGFTITRSGNTAALWNSNVKSNGVSLSSGGNNMTLQYCKVTGNRNGVYIGQSSNGNTVRRNIIDFNRTGVHVVDNSFALIEENFITNNWTMGVLYRTEGGPAPQGMTVRNNNISGNWFAQVEFREPATGGLLNFSGNYFGSGTPTRVTTPTGETGYSAQIPAAYGGGGPTSIPPVSPTATFTQAESGRIDYSPYLTIGSDTDAGTTGFQGDFSTVTVTLDAAQVGGGSRIQEGIGLVSAGGILVIPTGTYPGNVNVNKAVDLKGSFTVGGTLTVSATGASISPGNSPGIINSGNLSLGAGTTTNMEINGTTVGTQYDQLNVTGTVNISTSAALNVTLGFTPIAGNSFTIINNDLGDAVTGSFAGLPEGTIFYVLTTAFQISYAGGSGNDVVLTVVSPCNSVSIENESGVTGGTVDVDITTDNTTGNGLISTQFVITYDPAVVTFNAFNLGTVTAGRGVNINSSTPGVLSVSIYGSTPFAGAGTLGVITFNKVGLPGSSTPVAFSSFMFNEGTACISTTPGSVTIVGGTITGSVLYSEHGGIPVARAVPNVTVSGAGTPPVSALTDAFGAYSLSGFGAGSYTRSASKVGQHNGALSGFDSAAISQHVVNLVPITDVRKLFVADVSGNGTVTAFDASLIARFTVNLPGAGSSGTWVIKRTGVTPQTDLSTYGPSTVYANITGESYTAYLMGDVTGNWNLPTNVPGGRAARSEGEKPLRITAPELSAPANTELVVPVTVRDATGRGINSYQFDLRYNPEVLEPAADTTDLSGTISEGYSATVNPIEPGLLKVVVFGPNPLAGSGQLLKLKFNVIGEVNSVSTLTWETFDINEGGFNFDVMNGRVVVRAASNDAAIAGRVLNAAGQPVSGATVTLVDMNGQTRTARASSLGTFRFAELTLGQTYTISVSAKRYSFASQTISVTGDAVNLDLIAEQ